MSIGDITMPIEKPPIPRALLKFIVLNLPWSKNGPTHPVFGPMIGAQVSRLHAKHLNHHLTQFGV